MQREQQEFRTSRSSVAVTPDMRKWKVEEREFQAEGRACAEAQAGGRKGDQST